jgi:hypothetical protein
VAVKDFKGLENALEEIHTNWDPHMIQEFYKMSICSTLVEERKKVVFKLYSEKLL